MSLVLVLHYGLGIPPNFGTKRELPVSSNWNCGNEGLSVWVVQMFSLPHLVTLKRFSDKQKLIGLFSDHVLRKYKVSFSFSATCRWVLAKVLPAHRAGWDPGSGRIPSAAYTGPKLSRNPVVHPARVKVDAALFLWVSEGKTQPQKAYLSIRIFGAGVPNTHVFVFPKWTHFSLALCWIRLPLKVFPPFYVLDHWLRLGKTLEAGPYNMGHGPRNHEGEVAQTSSRL